MNINLLIRTCTYKFKQNTGSCFIAVILFVCSLSAAAQVVVIPLGGDEDSSAVWAQNGAGGYAYTAETGVIEINTISINVSKDGFLVISGTAYINNNNNTTSLFYLRPLIDGAVVASSVNFGLVELDNESGADKTTLSYTITAPISKGSHTISQTIQNNSGGSYFTDGETLSAMFYPAGSVTQKNSGPTTLAGSQLKTSGSSSSLDNSGDIIN